MTCRAEKGTFVPAAAEKYDRLINVWAKWPEEFILFMFTSQLLNCAEFNVI